MIMSEPISILTFDQVELGPTESDDRRLRGIDFRMGPGDIVLVHAAEEGPCPPLADAACGVLEPSAGRVLFEGKDWRDLSSDACSAARSRIGHVWDEHPFVSNLDLDENITLAQRHHTTRPLDEIREEALGHARRFGLDSLPAVRPAWASRRDLAVSQWIRALMGQPVLLLLERSTGDVDDEACNAWVESVASAAERGAGVLWVTSDPRVLNNPAIHAKIKYRVDDDRLKPD